MVDTWKHEQKKYIQFCHIVYAMLPMYVGNQQNRQFGIDGLIKPGYVA